MDSLDTSKGGSGLRKICQRHELDVRIGKDRSRIRKQSYGTVRGVSRIKHLSAIPDSIRSLPPSHPRLLRPAVLSSPSASYNTTNTKP